MDKINFECRICKKVTEQMILIVTDLLPNGSHVIQCTKCQVVGVAAVGEKS